MQVEDIQKIATQVGWLFVGVLFVAFVLLPVSLMVLERNVSSEWHKMVVSRILRKVNIANTAIFVAICSLVVVICFVAMYDFVVSSEWLRMVEVFCLAVAAISVIRRNILDFKK